MGAEHVTSYFFTGSFTKGFDLVAVVEGEERGVILLVKIFALGVDCGFSLLLYLLELLVLPESFFLFLDSVLFLLILELLSDFLVLRMLLLDFFFALTLFHFLSELYLFKIFSF